MAGIHLSGMFGFNPALRSLDGATYLAVKQAADREFPKVAKPLLLTTLAATVAFVVTAAAQGRMIVTVLAVVGLLALISVLASILRGDIPINQEIATWTAATLPASWVQTRHRWETFFVVRTLANLVAVAVLASAAVLAN